MNAKERISIAAKIRKLIGLAGNNPNEHERKEAMEKALAMLQEHNMTMDDVERLRERKVAPLLVSISAIDPWERAVAQAACELYYCRLLMHRTKHSKGLAILGTPENATVAAEIGKWLVSSIASEAKKFYREEKNRLSFKKGAAYAVLTRERAQLDRVMQPLICTGMHSVKKSVWKNKSKRQKQKLPRKLSEWRFRKMLIQFEDPAARRKFYLESSLVCAVEAARVAEGARPVSIIRMSSAHPDVHVRGDMDEIARMIDRANSSTLVMDVCNSPVTTG